MKTNLGLARVRWLCALTTVLGSSTMATAQFSTAVPASAAKDSDVMTIAISPIRSEATAAPAPAKADAMSTVDTGRAARAHWPAWPWLFGSTRPKVDKPSAPAATARPSAKELHRLQSGQASPVEVAAAKIKMDDAAAAARRAAIRYLAGVKDDYFPEVEEALIAALRTDRNESVRVDAAEALAGCCCTAKTMEALKITVSGSERDGKPAEISERVKSAASQALQRYAACGMAVPRPDRLAAAQPATNKIAPQELTLTGFTAPPLKTPLAASATGHKSAPAELQLTGLNILPLPAPKTPPPPVTDAERRFAETAGTPAPAGSSGPAAPSVTVLPEIRLRPIGAVPPATEK